MDGILYIDPGSGAVLWQLLLGAFLGIGYYFRNALRKVTRLFRRNGAD